MVVYKQMFWNIKTLQKWKLSTWEKITRQSNKTLVNLISIHGTRESEGLMQGAEYSGKDGICSSKDTWEIGTSKAQYAISWYGSVAMGCGRGGG